MPYMNSSYRTGFPISRESSVRLLTEPFPPATFVMPHRSPARLDDLRLRAVNIASASSERTRSYALLDLFRPGVQTGERPPLRRCLQTAPGWPLYGLTWTATARRHGRRSWSWIWRRVRVSRSPAAKATLVRGYLPMAGISRSFVRDNDGKSQIWIMSTWGGEARKLTDVAGGITDIAWSPDSDALAFVSDVDPDRAPDDHDPKKAPRVRCRQANQVQGGRSRMEGGGIQAHIRGGPVSQARRGS